MKTRIKKIIMIAAALLLVSSGVAFANDRNDRNQRPSGKAYGHYNLQKHHPGWNATHDKRTPSHSKRYVYKGFRNHRNYGFHHRRPAPRRNGFHRGFPKDSLMMFKIILKDHR